MEEGLVEGGQRDGWAREMGLRDGRLVRWLSG